MGIFSRKYKPDEKLEKIKKEEAEEIEQLEKIRKERLERTKEQLKKHKENVDILRINPDETDRWIRKGMTLYDLKQYADAIKCYDEAIRIEPNWDSVWLYKGDAIFKLGKYEDANKCYDEAIRINLNNYSAWYHKGTSLDMLEQYEEAIKCYDEAIRIEPTNDYVWHLKGLALYNLEKYEESIRCYDEAIRINPKDVLVLKSKSDSLNKLGKIEEATEYFNRSVELEKNEQKENSEFKPKNMTNVVEIFPKVLSSYADDVKHGIARLDIKSMKLLGVSEGDILELSAKRKSVGLCKLIGHSEEYESTIRIDGLIRYNIGAEIGDIITVRKTASYQAKNITVRPFSNEPNEMKLILKINSQYLADKLDCIPVIHNDIVMVDYDGALLNFLIVETYPSNIPVQINKETIFRIVQFTDINFST